ncbi:MAG: type II toxin-antitoxin system VapC family toxin [Deltaproteobacteria bacterium]|nr:type II toxin-antitoxin system VapC family toxin [Deltaproteobacteria bacterium]
MKAVYLETSFLLAWLFSESNAKAIARALSKAEAICTSTLTLLEAKRSLIRQESLKRITSAQRSQSLGLLEQASRNWFLMEINFPVKKRASESFPIEPVRSLDAIHLATALQFLEVYPDLEFLTLDDRIAVNLGPLGFSLRRL